MPTSAQKHAEEYGYQLAFLKSDPELYKIFQAAMKGEWDTTKFVAAVKNSKWYKTHGETYRTNLAQKTTDPASWKQKVLGQQASVMDLARSMGADLDSKTLAKLADDSLMFGWNDSQTRNALAAQIITTGKGQHGEAGTNVTSIMESAYRNGISITRDWANQFAAKIASGDYTLDDAKHKIRTMAQSLAPGFAKELEGGMDLYDIATPYMQSMAQTLELNPSEVDLFDPTIRKAMSTGTPDAKGQPQPGSTPLWQFEQGLRQDQRYMKTQKAQDQTMNVGRQVLADMGLLK
jgi:hypothetical protein